jgi:hypothetical protein
MKTSYRRKVNKSRSSKSFRKNMGTTKGANLRNAPMRGGYRL